MANYMVLTIDFEGGYGFFQTRQKSYSFTFVFVFAGIIFFFLQNFVYDYTVSVKMASI